MSCDQTDIPSRTLTDGGSLELSGAPTVSVVMIFLDAQAFIGQAIESVLNQTYRDFELILVDDGSTDGSTAIAQGYALRNSGVVRYTEHEGHSNQGMSASRNLGASLARGRLISFLDSDDLWLPERLRRYVSAIDAHPTAGMVYGPRLYWYSWQSVDAAAAAAERPRDFTGWLALPTGQLIPPPEPLRKWLESRGACLPGMNSLIIRREAFAAVGGFEAGFRGLHEDQVFLSKMAATHPVVIIPEVMDYYRQHTGSCCYRGLASGEYHPKFLNPARRRYLFWLEEYCRAQKIMDAGVRKALGRELWPYRSRLNGLLFTMRFAAVDRLRRTLRSVVPRPARQVLRNIRDLYRQMQVRQFL